MSARRAVSITTARRDFVVLSPGREGSGSGVSEEEGAGAAEAGALLSVSAADEAGVGANGFVAAHLRLKRAAHHEGTGNTPAENF